MACCAAKVWTGFRKNRRRARRERRQNRQQKRRRTGQRRLSLGGRHRQRLYQPSRAEKRGRQPSYKPSRRISRRKQRKMTGY